jgi:photosystem II stability/assembly factor-like uncharacterized protein
MRTFKISLLVLIFPITLFAQWYDKTDGVPVGYCNAIDAYDSLIATGPYANDSLYLTTDGGNSWFTRPLPSNLSISDISIKGSEKIWFCTWNGKIYNTSDGGFNWQLQFYDTSMTKFMNYLEMFDDMNGIAMGDAPAEDKPALFLRTTDGGMNWILQNDSELIGLWSGDLWRRVDFVNINVGYFYTFQAYPPTIYKTINGGKNWQVVSDTIKSYVLKAYDENIFLSEGAYGIISRTLDGGQTWESNQWSFMDWALDIEYIPGNPSNVWCVSTSMAFSSDTGKTWVNEYNLQSEIIYDMVFTDQDNGWLYTGGGGILRHIYRTTNGGHGGLIVSVDDRNPDLGLVGFSLEQNYPNPFNPSTIIKYTFPNVETRHASSPQVVTLKVYDLLGREIVTLVNEEKPAGEYEIEFSVGQESFPVLPSGVYFYQLKVYPANGGAGEFVETRKMVLIK